MNEAVLTFAINVLSGLLAQFLYDALKTIVEKVSSKK